MPLGIAPGVLLVVAVIGGIGSAVTYTAYRFAEKVGGQIQAQDLLPVPPPGFPLPRFIAEGKLK